MSLRTWLARKLLPSLPKVIEPPSAYEVERMADLVRLAQAEGRPFAPIPVEWIAAVLAERVGQHDQNATIRNFRIVQREGDRDVARQVEPVSRPFTFGTPRKPRAERELCMKNEFCAAAFLLASVSVPYVIDAVRLWPEVGSHAHMAAGLLAFSIWCACISWRWGRSDRTIDPVKTPDTRKPLENVLSPKPAETRLRVTRGDATLHDFVIGKGMQLHIDQQCDEIKFTVRGLPPVKIPSWSYEGPAEPIKASASEAPAPVADKWFYWTAAPGVKRMSRASEDEPAVIPPDPPRVGDRVRRTDPRYPEIGTVLEVRLISGSYLVRWDGQYRVCNNKAEWLQVIRRCPDPLAGERVKCRTHEMSPQSNVPAGDVYRVKIGADDAASLNPGPRDDGPSEGD